MCAIMVPGACMWPRGRPGEQRLLTMKKWGGSGIIGVIQNKAYARAVMTAEVPAVLIDPVDASKLPAGLLERYSVMASDQLSIGEMAASFFIERQYRHFAFVGEVHNINWSRDRGEAFARMVSNSGYACNVYGPLTEREKKGLGG